MADPLTATAIALLAFEGFIKGSSTEVTKEFTAAALAKLKTLQDTIGNKLRGNPDAKIALEGVKAGTEDDFAAVVTYLKSAMSADPEFAALVQNLGGEVKAEVSAIQLQRLKVQHQNLQEEWNTKNELIHRLRKARAIEDDPGRKFKLDQQIPEAEAELRDLTLKLEAIERDLPPD